MVVAVEPQLIDRIYEASAVADRWPGLLQDIAARVGAKGAMFMTHSPGLTAFVASPVLERHVADYVEQGWAADAAHSAPLMREQWPGFRSETDYRTPAEIARLPVHAEFMDPRGLVAGAGTVIQGARDDMLHMTLEGFASHGDARRAIGFLDALRPHLARAISLTAIRKNHSQLVVDSLALVGVAAAVIALDGRLRAANAPFVGRLGDAMVEASAGLRFADPFLNRALAEALDRHRRERGRVQSIALHGDRDVCAVHLLPITGSAREACGADGLLMLLAGAGNVSVPSADLLRLLFDLTPAEARVARRIAGGETVASVGRALRLAPGTVRVQLKAVFAKTGVNRQADLVRLLGTVAPPISFDP